MKKRTISERLRQWDAASFDLTDALPLEEPVNRVEPTVQPEDLPNIPGLESGSLRAFRRLYPWLAGLLCGVLILFLITAVLDLPPFGTEGTPTQNEVMDRYAGQGLEETGAVNLVAGVILDYRAFDTLGETFVLFTAAAAVLILLLLPGDGEPEPLEERMIMEGDPILRNTAKVLVPVILLFGLYIILNGHLGPGGGFAGGAILGGSLILYVIAFGFERLERWLNLKTWRRTVACALLWYSGSKCYSFFCGANHLQTVFGPGTPGRILSAGLIPSLNLAVGLVVACTLYGFYSVFQRGRI